MSGHSGSFVLSAAESADFARLSGDYNPLHLDPVYARRLAFGGTAIHGAHTLLAALDRSLGGLPGKPPGDIAGLSATFPNPVVAGQRIDYALTEVSDGSARLQAEADGKRVLAVSLTFAPRGELGDLRSFPEATVPEGSPADLPFPPGARAGALTLGWERALGERLFPALARLEGERYGVAVCACTRIVGMECPGLHSVFSALSLTFGPANARLGAPVLEWALERVEARVRLVSIRVAGPGITGKLDAFFRPEPVVQADFASVRARVPRGRFADQRALVIGGTRGAGETTAKVLAAGGAEVAITYRQGAGDAERVRAEIAAGGGRCQVLALDVAEDALALTERVSRGSAPTHCYYFASPHIASNKGRAFDAALFAGFCSIYVDAFARLVRALVEGPSPGCAFFFPSSIYIERPEKGFAEYAAAKGAGEVLCTQLAARYPGTRFLVPRLARMATDQTVGIVPVKSRPALDEMLEHLLAIEPSP